MAETGLGAGGRAIVEGLLAARVGVVASVPDSWLGPLLARVAEEASLRASVASREEEAIGICCGAALAGTRAVAILQNSGVMNCGSILTTLVHLYRIPLFMLVSFRGNARDPVFFHTPKGQVTLPVLDALRVPYAHADRGGDLARQVVQGLEYAEASEGPFALLLTGEDLR